MSFHAISVQGGSSFQRHLLSSGAFTVGCYILAASSPKSQIVVLAAMLAVEFPRYLSVLLKKT
jgi:hypothetical protein